MAQDAERCVRRLSLLVWFSTLASRCSPELGRSVFHHALSANSHPWLGDELNLSKVMSIAAVVNRMRLLFGGRTGGSKGLSRPTTSPAFIRREFTGARHVENERFTNFEPGSEFRQILSDELKLLRTQTKQVPVVVNGEKVYTDEVVRLHMPSDHSVCHSILSLASRSHIGDAIKGSLEAQHSWERLPIESRSHVFMKAAHLLTTKYRASMLAATMLGQAKTAFQADIDCICELADFIKYNVNYAENMYKANELNQSEGVSNMFYCRPLEGFVAALSPFNFTAIGGNLCIAPALVGNVVLWKPSFDSIPSNYLLYEILMEAGLPKGVIQFLPSNHTVFGEVALVHPCMTAINFTGSTKTFELFWNVVGRNISSYRSFPRLIGETGGANYHLVHTSANIDVAVNSTIRSAFEYSGQKCSACSKVYVPESLWTEFRERLLERMEKVVIGQPDDYRTFTSAVINRSAYDRLESVIASLRNDSKAEVIHGGECDDSRGYFIFPTLVKVEDKNHPIMREETFGPILCVYVYKDESWSEITEHINASSYGLTGAVFCTERKALEVAEDRLRNSAGNFYVNDKSTGAVVGHQPFGGGRKSGTNDKPGHASYLMRFVSPMVRKENYQHSSGVTYTYME